MKYKLYLLLIICFEILFQADVNGQSTFNVLPITAGQDNQSHLFDVLPDSNFIYVIGDLLDTTINPLDPTARPWWGVFDYDGNLIHQKVLHDTSFTGSINLIGSRILKLPNANFVYAPLMRNEKGKSECLLVQLSPDGDIIKTRIIGNPYDTSYLRPRWITTHPFRAGHIILSTDIEIDQIRRGCIFLIDSHFHVSDTILIEDPERFNVSYYIEADSDSTFIIIGNSTRRNDSSEDPDVKPFYLRTNLDGHILAFNLGQGIPDKTVGFFLTDSYSVRRDQFGNWIFACVSFFPGWHTQPYVFSYNSDFTTMNWAINFSPDKENTNLAYHMFAGDFDTLSQTYVCVGFDAFQPNGDAFIFKARANGDSLWTRHFIPLNWNPEDIYYIELRDVKVTPYQSYVSVGMAIDQETKLIKSWAIHIDSFGCIIPGCHLTVSISGDESTPSNSFLIYPNPTSSYVGILTHHYAGELTLQVYDLNGKLIEDIDFTSNVGDQYILDTSRWMNGMYMLQIMNPEGVVLSTEKIIKQ